MIPPLEEVSEGRTVDVELKKKKKHSWHRKCTLGEDLF